MVALDEDSDSFVTDFSKGGVHLDCASNLAGATAFFSGLGFVVTMGAYTGATIGTCVGGA